jgi:hypothetical protein
VASKNSLPEPGEGKTLHRCGIFKKNIFPVITKQQAGYPAISHSNPKNIIPDTSRQ